MMIKTKAYAKLNLNLHIIPDKKYKTKTGYYPVRSINCEIDLHDDLIFEAQKEKIDLICDNKELSNSKNIIYKTALLLKEVIHKPNVGVRMTLKKNIPIKAGFGGGSSDAAIAIKSLEKLWDIHISSKQKKTIINKLGSDVFYSMKGGVCEVSGKGDRIRLLSNLIPKLWLIIILPEYSKPSTDWMYSKLKLNTIGENLKKYKQLKKAIIQKNKKNILNLLHNDFEHVVSKQYPSIIELKKDLLNNRALQTLIAGSGLGIIGFYTSRKEMKQAYKKLKVTCNENIIWTSTR